MIGRDVVISVVIVHALWIAAHAVWRGRHQSIWSRMYYILCMCASVRGRPKLPHVGQYEALLVRPWPASARTQPSYTAMRLKKHAPLFESPLKRVARRPVASSLCNRCRRYASSQAYPEKVAILGGGISGLASAYFVSKEFPQSKITVYEANKDSGGWIQSRRVDVPGGHVLFEYGARTLRPGRDASITAQLVGT